MIHALTSTALFLLLSGQLLLISLPLSQALLIKRGCTARHFQLDRQQRLIAYLAGAIYALISYALLRLGSFYGYVGQLFSVLLALYLVLRNNAKAASRRPTKIVLIKAKTTRKLMRLTYAFAASATLTNALLALLFGF